MPPWGRPSFQLTENLFPVRGWEGCCGKGKAAHGGRRVHRVEGGSHPQPPPPAHGSAQLRSAWRARARSLGASSGRGGADVIH